MTESVSGSQPHHHWRSPARSVVLNRTIGWCSKPQILSVWSGHMADSPLAGHRCTLYQMGVNDRWLKILLAPTRDGISVAEACRRCGISRQSFYQYRRRLCAEGTSGLQPRSRRRTNSPGRTAGEVEPLIVRLRADNPRWGARILQTKLKQAGLDPVPAISTVHRVLIATDWSAGKNSGHRRHGNGSSGTPRTTCGRLTALRLPWLMVPRPGLWI
jgi:transposase